MKVRPKKGLYQIEKALCTRFIDFTGNNYNYDLTDVQYMIDTKLFRQTSVAGGKSDIKLYCAMEISGNNKPIDMEHVGLDGAVVGPVY